MPEALIDSGARRRDLGSRPPAVVLGGHASALAVIRALGRAGIPVVSVYDDERQYAQVSRYVSRRHLAPDPGVDPEEYVRTLESLGEEYADSLLVTAYDEALMAVSQHHDRLSERFKVGSMRWELTQRCLDKKETYALAGREGIPVPRTFSPSSIDELRTLSDRLSFPCLVKPRLSHLFARAQGGQMVKVESREELLRTWTQVREAGLDVLVQEFIPGPDHNGANYNVYASGGEVLAEMTAHKLRSKRPEIASPRMVLSRWIPEVAELGRRVVEAVGIEGFVNMEFKRHAVTGVFYLIEINARPNLSGALAVRCGVNFPLIEYKHRVEGVRPHRLVADTGVYWISLEWDLREGRRLAMRRELPRNYLRPYLEPHVHDVLDWRDPGPIRKLMTEMARARSTASGS